MTTIYTAIYKDAAHLDKYGEVKSVRYPHELVDTDSILILHGGADISPCLYKQTANSYTGADNFLSIRDMIETELVKQAIKLDIPIFGICRGAQLLTAVAGGSLVQHVTNHGGYHGVTTIDGEEFPVTSAHHQMCDPTGTEHELLAWTTEKRSNVYLREHNLDIPMEVEPELIYYPYIKALACQPHPEWMDKSEPFVQYLLKQIEEKLL